MKTKVAMFLASLFVAIMLVAEPQTGDAAMLRPLPEFGSRELGQVLDDFMLKTRFNPGKYYSVESKSTYGDITTHVIEQGNNRKMSRTLKIKTNAEGVIIGITFQAFIPEGMSNSSIESFHNGWGAAVISRYGNPTEAGYGQQYGYPYSKFIEDGKYKYRIDTFRMTATGQPTAAGKGPVMFSVDIDAI